MRKLTFLQVCSDEAASFWSASPHASIFTHVVVLAQLCRRVDWWLCKNGEQPLCLWPVCLDTNYNACLPPFSYYVGPMWSVVGLGIPVHRQLSQAVAVYEGFIEILGTKYGRITASLPRGLDDVRVFDWWNYHIPTGPRFTIKPRYSACIRDMQSKSMSQIESGFRQLRRRELRRSERNNLLKRCSHWRASEVLQLYTEILARESVELDIETRASIENIISLAQRGFGDILVYKSVDNNSLSYVSVLLYGKACANLILNLVSADVRSAGYSAMCIRDTIHCAKTYGCDVFDFNGANSPSRGDDKHSYGAAAELYFQIDL